MKPFLFQSPAELSPAQASVPQENQTLQTVCCPPGIHSSHVTAKYELDTKV